MLQQMLVFYFHKDMIKKYFLKENTPNHSFYCSLGMRWNKTRPAAMLGRKNIVAKEKNILQDLKKLLMGSALTLTLIISGTAPAFAYPAGNEYPLAGNHSGGIPPAFSNNDRIINVYAMVNPNRVSDHGAQPFSTLKGKTRVKKYDRNIKIENFQSDINEDKTNVYVWGEERTVNKSLFNNMGGSRGYHRDSRQESSIDPLREPGSNEAKYTLVFGSTDKQVYQSAAEAQANMVTISIDVWQLRANGEKYPAKLNLTVNKAIADLFQSVFKEIFEGQEKFPIYSVQGYAWRSGNTSEHNWGLAVDINPNENYMINSSGTIVAGSFWAPANSPHSIPENGDVVTAFNKYGFTWGGNAWKSSNDYMHFSYLGR
jgi:hypothetical protein